MASKWVTFYNQLFAYLSDHNILFKHQSGFCALHLTVTAFLEATDSWACNTDIGNINAVVLLDLNSNFDADTSIILYNWGKNNLVPN